MLFRSDGKSKGGAIAKNARKEIEEKTGSSVISPRTAKDVKELDK